MVSHSAENLYVSTDKRRSVWKIALRWLNNHIFKMNLDTPHNSFKNRNRKYRSFSRKHRWLCLWRWVTAWARVLCTFMMCVCMHVSVCLSVCWWYMYIYVGVQVEARGWHWVSLFFEAGSLWTKHTIAERLVGQRVLSTPSTGITNMSLYINLFLWFSKT